MQKTIILALLLSCGAAQASDWVSVGSIHKGKWEVSVDAATIRITGITRHAWIRIKYAAQTQMDASIGAGKWWKQAMLRYEFNCADATSRAEETNVTFEDDTVDFDSSSGRASSWHPVLPATILSKELVFVCEWEPK